jgi:hypothetical protein
VSATACMRDGPECRNVLHNRVSLEEWKENARRRRLVRVRIDPYFLTEMLNPPDMRPRSDVIHEVEPNLPPDARVVHVIADTASPCLIAFVRSDTFEPVPFGHEVPEFRLLYTRREVPA